MFRYRLQTPDGGRSRRFHVIDVAPLEEEDESPFVGPLQVGPTELGNGRSLDETDLGRLVGWR